MKAKRNVFFSLLGLGVIIAASIGWYQYQRPHDDLRRIPSSATLAAHELFAQFNQNETKAATQYVNQVLTVEGVLADKSQVDPENVILLLSVPDEMFGISCAFQGEEGAAAMQAPIGSAIKVKGWVVGMNLDVNLVRCLIDE